MHKTDYKVDLCVIGAGAAGLSVAAGAAQLGLSVVLFEQGDMGGDCLNTGCVPSKSLIATANAVHAMAHNSALGLTNSQPTIDWDKVRRHITGVIDTIAPIDSQARFESLGCTVVRERAVFSGPKKVESASTRVRARRYVIATGARAFVPDIAGLDKVPYLTNDTIFAQKSLPKSLIILGGGFIGVELGQAFARLGCTVTLIEGANLLGNQDPEAVALVRESLVRDRVTLLEGKKAVAVSGHSSAVTVTLEDNVRVSGERLLVAVGRAPRVEAMGLELAGVDYNKKGIVTDDRLRSVSNRRVWALGDVAGKEQLTHAAGFHAGVFVRNALFGAPAHASVAYMPAVAYCDPELAQIGLTEQAAQAKFGDAITIARASFEDNDRAQTQHATTGFCKLIIGKGGALLGATIVGEGAGEAIQLVGLAIANKLKVRALTSLIAPYPTRSEIVKRAAGAYFTPTLFSPKTQKLVQFLSRWR
ncbi:MAG: hypothetical protein RLZZ157_440 [Pseudomonadota bacterium]|jgi:pyruvate/2-oxoglutarate dehydrogenase complex dihydrolipoamide dehydrogenase (E3) component